MTADDKPAGGRVSINARIGADLVRLLEEHCERTGQSKTVAVERAILAYCSGGGDRDG